MKRSPARPVLRSLAAAVVAIGLALMHGGVGQAMTCDGLSTSAMSPIPAATPSMNGAGSDSGGDHSMAVQVAPKESHPSPVNAHVPEMCVATADTPPTQMAGSSAKPTASTGAIHHFIDDRSLNARHRSGRQPPSSNVVAVLCVNRR